MSNKKTCGILYTLVVPEGDDIDSLNIESQFRVSKMVRQLYRAQSELNRYGNLPITLITNLNHPFLPHINIVKIPRPEEKELPLNSMKLPRGIPLDSVYGKGYKIKLLELSPYDQTIYLDLDTFITGQFTEILEYLNYADLTVPVNDQLDTRPWLREVVMPMSTVFDTGVFAYNNTENVKELFNCWFNRYKYMLETFHRPNCIHSAFTEAILFCENIRVIPIAKNYNFRTKGPGPHSITGQVKIVHDSTASDMFLKTINESISTRMVPGCERFEKEGHDQYITWPADEMGQLEACLWVETYLKDFETFHRLED